MQSAAGHTAQAASLFKVPLSHGTHTMLSLRTAMRANSELGQIIRPLCRGAPFNAYEDKRAATIDPKEQNPLHITANSLFSGPTPTTQAARIQITKRKQCICSEQALIFPFPNTLEQYSTNIY